MLWCFQTHMHPPKSTRNVWFWKQIQNQNRVQNKNQLNESLHMFFIFLYSIKEVNVVWYTWLPAILFNFIFTESYVTFCPASEIATGVKEVVHQGANVVFPSTVCLDSHAPSWIQDVCQTSYTGCWDRPDRVNVPSPQEDETSGNSPLEGWKEIQSDDLPFLNPK